MPWGVLPPHGTARTGIAPQYSPQRYPFVPLYGVQCTARYGTVLYEYF